MAAVDKTKINSAPHGVVLDILRNSSYITDPRRGAGTRNRKFVYRHEPDTTSLDFSLYPFIVCKPAIKEQSKQSADQKTQEIGWMNQIIIKTAFNGSGQNKDDVGMDDMLSIMDDIDLYFESSAVRKDFKDNLLNFQDIRCVRSCDQIDVGGKMVYETIYEIRYRTRLVVK